MSRDEKILLLAILALIAFGVLCGGCGSEHKPTPPCVMSLDSDEGCVGFDIHADTFGPCLATNGCVGVGDWMP